MASRRSRGRASKASKAETEPAPTSVHAPSLHPGKRWVVSASGSAIPIEASRARVQALAFGAPSTHAPRLEGLLDAALGSGGADAVERPVVHVLQDIARGLLEWHKEAGTLGFCALVFIDSDESIAFAHVGGGEPELTCEGEPFPPVWRSMQSGGAAARAFSVRTGVAKQFALIWRNESGSLVQAKWSKLGDAAPEGSTLESRKSADDPVGPPRSAATTSAAHATEPEETAELMARSIVAEPAARVVDAAGAPEETQVAARGPTAAADGATTPTAPTEEPASSAPETAAPAVVSRSWPKLVVERLAQAPTVESVHRLESIAKEPAWRRSMERAPSPASSELTTPGAGALPTRPSDPEPKPAKPSAPDPAPSAVLPRVSKAGPAAPSHSRKPDTVGPPKRLVPEPSSAAEAGWMAAGREAVARAIQEIRQKKLGPATIKPLVAIGFLLLFGLGALIGRSPDVGPPVVSTLSPIQRVLDRVGLGSGSFRCMITSVPEGAEVAVNGRKVDGKTPLCVVLVPGKHDVRLSLPDAGSKTFPVTGFATERVPLDTRLWGSVQVRLVDRRRASSVAVSVDGEELGLAPLMIDYLKPGPHELEFSSVGQRQWSRVVNVRINEVTDLTIRPLSEATTGVLEVRASAKDEDGGAYSSRARVWVDGRMRGQTPLTLELPAGPHSVRAQFAGEQSAVQVIDLPGGNQRFATFAFGVRSDAPRLELRMERGGPQQPARMAVDLPAVRPNDLGSVWLHMRRTDGTWSRLPMAVSASSTGSIGRVELPISQAATRKSVFYASAQMVTGEEYFTEISAPILSRSRVVSDAASVVP